MKPISSIPGILLLFLAVNIIPTNILFAQVNDEQAAKVYDSNKDNIVKCHDFLKEFSRASETEEIANMAVTAKTVFKLSEQILSEMSAAIEVPYKAYSNYYKVNPDAQAFQLSLKMSGLKSNLEKATAKLDGFKQELIDKSKESAEWIGSPYGNLRHAPRVMNEIKQSFEILEKCFPDDADVSSQKNAIVPLAQQNYDKLLKDVASNKMAGDKYSESDIDDLKKEIETAYNKNYPADKVLKVSIISESWISKTELVIKDDKVFWENNSYINAQVATGNNESAKVWVLTFKKDESKTISLYSIGTNFMMLTKNL